MGCINEHEQSEPALAELQWKTLSEIRAQFVASQLYKITHDLALNDYLIFFMKRLPLGNREVQIWLPIPLPLS